MSDTKRVPFWTKRLVNNLIDSGLVLSAKYDRGAVFTIYKSGIKRIYEYRDSKMVKFVNQLDAKNSIINLPLPIHYEFEWNPFDEKQKEELSRYFHISRKDIDNMTFMDKELLIQDVLLRVVGNYIRPYVPEEAVDKELKRIKKFTKIYHNGKFNFNSGRRLGKPIIEKYWPIEIIPYKYINYRLTTAFNDIKTMFNVLYKLVHKTRKDVNITSIHSQLYGKYGPKWVNPVVCAAVLKQAFGDMSNRILCDISPNINEKYLTAWYLGCRYASDIKPPQGIIDKLGLEVEDLDEKYDVVLLDNGFRWVPDFLLERAYKKSKDLIVWAHKRWAKYVLPDVKPTRVFKIVAKCLPHKFNYLFIYRS